MTKTPNEPTNRGGRNPRSAGESGRVIPSLWIKRWVVLSSAGFALGMTLFFGSLAYRAWRIPGLSPAQRADQAQAMLRYVEDQLRNHSGMEQFETFFPDAGIVGYMIYGEAVVNVGLAEQSTARNRRRLSQEVVWCLEQLSDPEILDTFPDTQVRFGLFLLSRRTLLLAGLHLIDESPSWELTDEYHENCREMAEAFRSSRYGLLDSFPQFCWTGDNLVGLRCLRLHDEKFGTDYASAAEKWKEWAEGALNPRTGTLPFKVNSITGEVLTPTFGSAQALCLIGLRDVDAELFQEQYLAFKKHFGNSFLDLPTYREYPEGTAPQKDIDTGPIIRGHGVLATLMGMTASKLAGDLTTFSAQMGLIEAGAFPKTKDNMRRYLRGRFLMLDALAAYTLSAVPWSKSVGPTPDCSSPPKRPWLFLGALLALPFLSILTALVRYARSARKVRPLLLWSSASPSSEGIVLFWCQAAMLISVFYSTLWFPVIWTGFGIVGRAASFGLRLMRRRQST